MITRGWLPSGRDTRTRRTRGEGSLWSWSLFSPHEWQEALGSGDPSSRTISMCAYLDIPPEKSKGGYSEGAVNGLKKLAGRRVVVDPSAVFFKGHISGDATRNTYTED